ncbi:MauE/DoxX family redox-associated membrane protein [Flavobacterium sp.]|uniref:MauE/DoxX family redox-associated membrane protein n=1 Tax=Flavobacterium sp. TaxID=239 RepID=UPI003751D2A9
METKKNYIAWTIRIIVAFLFILSAVAKLSKSHLFDSPYFAISTFEVKQLYSMGFSQSIAPYFSRTLIGIELALGFLLLQKHWLKKFIIPVTILLLVVFVGHLTYVTFLSGGNSGNCGCFGELIPMTPIEAIIKNIIAIGLLGYLYYLLPKEALEKHNFWVLTTVLFATILGIFMLAPIQPVAQEFVNVPVDTVINDTTSITVEPLDTISNKVISLIEVKKDSVKNIDSKVKEIELVNANEPKKVKSGFAKFYPKIDTGKQLLCFFAPGCDHCKETAKELTEMRKKDATLPPVSIIFMNEEAFLIPDFFKAAGANYPYKVIEIIPFWNVLGSNRNTPGVNYLWNGNEIIFYDGIDDKKFDGKNLSTYLAKTKEDLKK